ncbi:MAG: hypothetical protein A2Y81_08245 [Nitrospirae bacterium RBG_13_43_8]|nr:MAG: hypothetical protein A2Y81_08245 [Nitrospirae bacterium RBG_13_43_8]
MPLFEGLVSGLAAGILMGLISHAGFKVGIFKSSILIIDGMFVQQRAGLKYNEQQAVLFGVPVHLFTSLSFGLSYAVLISIMKLQLVNGWLITLYVLMLWLSMLFVALPIAGQGLLGRRLGPLTWIEQMVLHVIFGIGLWGILYLLH